MRTVTMHISLFTALVFGDEQRAREREGEKGKRGQKTISVKMTNMSQTH